MITFTYIPKANPGGATRRRSKKGATSAATDPSKVLSLGLRVDFPRRRVASLLGRSSTVPDKVSYVPCVNNALGALDEVWRGQAPHADDDCFRAKMLLNPG